MMDAAKPRRSQYERRAIKALQVSMGGVNHTTALREFERLQREQEEADSRE